MHFALLFAISFYGMGAYEARDGSRNHGWFWALLSIAVSAVVISLLHGGLGMLAGAQVLLFVAIGVVRATFHD